MIKDHWSGPGKQASSSSHLSTLRLAIMMTYSRSIPFALLALFGSTGLAQRVDGPEFNKPYAGTPGSYFAASPSIPVAALHSAAAKASTAVPDGTYPINGDRGAKRVTIHTDWTNFDEVDTRASRSFTRSAD